jgi:hypothetical protein
MSSILSQSAELSRTELVEWIVACALLVVGTSLLVRARFWMNAASTSLGHPLVPLFSGLYALLMGLVVVVLHNLWVADARVIVTILGWVALTIGVILLVAPELYAALLRRIPLTPGLVALRGLVRIALGGAVVGYLLTQG